MNETPNTLTAEFFDAMVDAYETWAEPLSARLAQVALRRTTVSAGDCVLDIGAGTGAVGQEAFKVQTGECVFLPRFVPHAFVVRSPRLQVLTLFTPGGFEGAFRGEGIAAENLDLPSKAITYSMVDLEQTARRVSAFGIRFLMPDEIAEQLRLYPKPVPLIPRTKTPTASSKDSEIE